MNWKRILQVFLGAWAVLIFLTVLTGAGEEMTPASQVICTGVLAALIALLAMLATRGEKKKCFRLLDAADGELRYRVEGEWIYAGREEKASWYLKRGAVYSFDSMKPLYRVKNGEVTRAGEDRPFLRVEGGRVVDCAAGKAVYEIRE